MLIICSFPVSATTVINSKYSGTISAGDTVTFPMTIKADNGNETGIPLTVTKGGGSLCQWVTLDKTTFKQSSEGTPITAKITVPAGADNGEYQCSVQYTAPPSGMFTARIEVPLTVTVKDGQIPAASPTAAPAIEQTAKSTINAPVQQHEIPVIKATPEEEDIAGIPIVYFTITAGIIACVFVIVLIYDYRRGKKQ